MHLKTSWTTFTLNGVCLVIVMYLLNTNLNLLRVEFYFYNFWLCKAHCNFMNFLLHICINPRSYFWFFKKRIRYTVKRNWLYVLHIISPHIILQYFLIIIIITLVFTKIYYIFFWIFTMFQYFGYILYTGNIFLSLIHI